MQFLRKITENQKQTVAIRSFAKFKQPENIVFCLTELISVGSMFTILSKAQGLTIQFQSFPFMPKLKREFFYTFTVDKMKFKYRIMGILEYHA